jgi:hypothetical protein
MEIAVEEKVVTYGGELREILGQLFIGRESSKI